MQQLFEREYPKCERALFLTALGYLHDTEDARDALQDAALSAYQSLDTLRNKEYFKTWMTRIVINKCKNILKSRRSTEELTDSIGVFCTVPEGEIEVLDAICRMESKDAVYISLRFYNGMNYDEMARVLRQPVSTVKYRTKKSLQQLKNVLEGDA